VKRHKIFAILLVMLGLPSWGQDGHSIPAAPIGPELPYTEVLTPPTPVNLVQLPLTFASDGERSNILSGSIQVGSGYNDNALVTPTDHIGNVSTLIVPRIEIRQNRERWSLDLAYSPGVTTNQNLSEQNQFAHNLSVSTNYRLSPHVSLQVRDNFAKTNNLFSGLFGSTAGPGPLQQSNSSVITPLADSRSNNAGLGLTYQFSASSLVGVSGNYYFVNYGEVAGTPGISGFIDSRSASAATFYAHRFSNRHWVGATYNFQQLMFDPGGRTTIHRALGFYSLVLGTHMTLSLWAGPQYSTTYVSSILIPQLGAGSTLTLPSQWTPAGGVMYSWGGSRTGLHVGYSRLISDGSGVAEAVNSQQVDAEIRQRLAARWTAITGVAYARNNPLHRLSTTAPLRSLRGNAGIEYRLTDNLGMGFSYERQQQQYEYPLLPSATANQNRVWFSLSYGFARPLGR